MPTFATFIEQARTNASALDPRQVLLTILAAPFFAIGWLAGAVARTFWAAVTLTWGFIWAAGQLGFQAAHGRRENR